MLLGGVLLYTFTGFSQGLVIDTTYTINQLVSIMVGSGVQLSNVQVNCDPRGYGYFNGTGCNVGLDSGMVITSGYATNAIGPNDSPGITGNTGLNGDPDLNNLIPGYSTYDACIFEFDIIPVSDTIRFSYVFGSDEYLEYVNTSFNDVFGFFISGPGIVGTQNIALIPGTSTPVSINNVNNVSNSSYYIINGDGFTAPQNQNAYYIQYDGLTTVLEASVVVQPCQTYHLKLAVADAGDHVLDSGVFLKAGSISSPGVNVTVSSSVGGGFSNAIEGCVDGIFTFHSSKVLSTPQIVHFNIGGTATPGLDYLNIPDSVVIPSGSDSAQVIISPLQDALTEGNESVELFVLSPCFATPVDTALLYIEDPVQANAGPDTAICTGDSLQLYAGGGVSYLWSPANTLTDSASQAPVAFPDTNTTYQVIVSNQYGCSDTAWVHIQLIYPQLDAGNDTAIPLGASLQLQAVGTGNSFTWSPPIWLDNPNIANPVTTPEEKITYTVTMITDQGCQATDSVTIDILTKPLIFVPNAFSPNGDGRNDRFYPIVYGYVELVDFSILNRWGQVIFHTSDPGILNGVSAGWDGTFRNVPQDPGVYTYIFKGKDEFGDEVLVSGNLTLIR